jgi:intracellular multiplication protein IcmE
MSSQASSLMSSWLPPATQQAIVTTSSTPSAASAGVAGAALNGGVGGFGMPGQSGDNILAGSVLFAVLDTGIDSDDPSPIMATIIQGKLKGAKLLGTFKRNNETVTLSFTTLSHPRLNNSLSIDTVAISQDTARTAVASSVDNHYLLKYGTLFASSFLSGLGTAISQSGATVSTTDSSSSDSSGGLWSVTTQDLNTEQTFAVALGNVGTKMGQQLAPMFDQLVPTVKVNSGTGMGILFMKDFQLPPELQ